MKIVTIGGGTGHFVLLSGLKDLNVDISAIVTVADSGGSTGRLRDEFGYLPMGDFRMSLVALADEDHAHVLRELFLYRFDKGDGLKGHNFGNLFLVALTDILGSETAAFDYASKILNVKGTILPISTGPVSLVAEYSDGSVLESEALIDDPPAEHNKNTKITKLAVKDDSSVISQAAMQAIKDADYIILGPGDLYTSIIANLVVSGVKEAFQQSAAKVIFICNLVTKYGQTTKYSVLDHVNDLQAYIGKSVDYVVLNSEQLPAEALQRYHAENSSQVIDDIDESVGINIVRVDLLAEGVVKKRSGDVLKRSLIRHDPQKLAKAISKIINTENVEKHGLNISELINKLLTTV